MTTPLFSTYRAGENRVTSSFLAVLERLPVYLIEELLGAATGDSALTMVAFANQYSSATGAATVPDAAIVSNFQWLFEVKTAPNSVSASQLRGHLTHLAGSSEPNSRLFLLTPDPSEPSAVSALGDSRLTWFSFSMLNHAIDDLLDRQADRIGDRATFLLRELQLLFREDGLLDYDDVVIVAARWAYPEYLEHSIYICQPGRAFKAGVTWMGFYAEGFIQCEIATIVHRVDQLVFNEETVRRLKASTDPIDQIIAAEIVRSVKDGIRRDDLAHQVFVLSPPTDAHTVTLAHKIRNDTLDKSGKPCAWTFGQRYTRLSSLRASPRLTSQLV